MTAKSQKLYQEQLKLTKWFSWITAFCVALLAASYFWFHSMLALVLGLMFGPIFLFLTIVYGALAVSSKLRMTK